MIAKDTLFAKHVVQRYDAMEYISRPPGLELSTAASLSDPMLGLDTWHGELL